MKERRGLEVWSSGATQPTRAEMEDAYRLAAASSTGSLGRCACGGFWAVRGRVDPEREHVEIGHTEPPCDRFRDTWLYFRQVILPASADA